MSGGKKILVMGLPGSGKTTFATALVEKLGALHLNADTIRKKYDDWDFSDEGRLRQADRMNKLAEQAKAEGKVVVADFICPTEETRRHFNADTLIWMDTIKKGRFDDTNRIFEPPQKCDFRIDSKNATHWVTEFCNWMGKNNAA